MSRRLALVVIACLAVAGCAQASSTVAGLAPSSTRAAVTAPAPGGSAVAADVTPAGVAPLPSDLSGCPQPTPIPSDGPRTAVDYVDFVDANGDTYLGGLEPKLADADRGALQLRVTCTVSTWSDRYMQAMANKDGNAAFLPTGTRVYAVNRESPLCQLMAKAADGWHLYRAAQNPACTTGEAPVATALPATPSTGGLRLGLCPTPHPATKNGQGVAVDYGDFVQFGGTAFVVDDRLKVTASDKGAPAFRVRCPLGLLNDATHLQPPAPRDGDSSYLAAGTEVFAILGFSSHCRLMAEGPSGWVAYTPRPTPGGCPSIGVRAATSAVPPAGTAVTAPGLPDATSGGRLTHPLNSLGGNGGQAEPPPMALVPTVGAAAAYASCRTDQLARCATDKGPTITLALVSTDVGGRVRADGSVRRVLDGSPAWILTWAGLTCFPVSGGPAVSSAAPEAASAAAYPCTRTSLVDATSGRWVSTGESADGPSRS